ncbi:hypothetical protein FDE94_08960 [Clostridium botulinum]|nr:hypothetical protein [Clostridium botulinum]
MNFISIEEFLKQSKKVQSVLLEWWNSIPKNKRIYDLATYKDKKMVEIVWFYPSKTWKDLIPLLQMHQLIQFIEDKTNTKYDIIYSNGKNQFINFYNMNVDEDKPIYKINEHNLLQALWQVTIKIAEEALNE